MAELVAFTIAAAALLGSPGPGIAALVAAGRSLDRASALRFYGGMQLGLALAAAASAAGLASLLAAAPGVQRVFVWISALYLIWLAWKVATAPLGAPERDSTNAGFTSRTGFLLGVANPKAYLAFLSLMGAFRLMPSDRAADGAVKWAICVAVMVVVDFGWLALGALIGSAPLPRATERTLNVAMGASILAACIAGLV